jgi:hypothetical protein
MGIANEESKNLIDAVFRQLVPKRTINVDCPAALQLVRLTFRPLFCNYGNMQQRAEARSSLSESVLADVVLEELKKQSQNGCRLCSLDALDAEEWD